MLAWKLARERGFKCVVFESIGGMIGEEKNSLLYSKISSTMYARKINVATVEIFSFPKPYTPFVPA